MEWNLPTSVEINGEEHKIRNKCDYRVVLDTINALNDEELDDRHKIECSLFIFYENSDDIDDVQTALDEMMRIINLGDSSNDADKDNTRVMNWEHDFPNIAPPVSRVLGYSVRDKNNYTHWYDFVGAYMEIGDCYFSQIMSVRLKRLKGKKLDESDRNFYKEHKKDVDLPIQLSSEEQDWLDSDW